VSYTDALNRIGLIETQLAALDGSSAAATALGAGGQTSSTTTSTSGSASTSFADALASAQAAPTDASAASTDDTAPVSGVAAGSDATGPLTATTAVPVTTAAATSSAPATASPVTLTPAATSQLTTDQQQFVARLAQDTGLDPQVVSAWVLAEESGSAATARQGASNNDWLNIGYTDSATYGADDSVWSDPITAADATAGWLAGQDTVPGYGTASAGVQSILGTAGQPAATQIAAIQGSGWASSGYPDLPALYAQVSG